MTINTQTGGQHSPVSASLGNPLSGLLTRLVALAAIDAFAIWFLVRLIADGVWFLALVVAAVTLLINLFYLRENLYAYRWFAPGLALMFILVLYPTAFTVYVAFTNYGTGNLLTLPQTLRVLTNRTYSPEDAITYDWTPYVLADRTATLTSATAEDILLWIQAPDGTSYIARPDQPFEPAADVAPDAVEGFVKVSKFQAATIPLLEQITFGTGDTSVRIDGLNAKDLQSLYSYDEATKTLTDNQTNVTYTAVRGTFTAADGSSLSPGYYVPIGFDNFVRLFRTELFGRGEAFVVFTWTFLFAFGSVFLTFWVGLGLAIVLNHPLVPFKKIFRSFMLIPYAIPAFISVLVWRGLFDPNLGVVNDFLNAVTFGAIDFIDWRGSVIGARSAILLIQLWLGFPYMLLICTGALQGIPADMYEAAEVDGAGPFAKFWQLTLPLLLVAVGPLLIASFAFNFNNFTVIQLYNDGRPTISTTSVAGYTDILITYTYEVAFSSGRGQDYGFATAITIVIFVLLTTITLFNFRLTRRLEEISENV
ncbi:MAG: ABC transporter permease subunit [Phototrophicaceae bacterium]